MRIVRWNMAVLGSKRYKKERSAGLKSDYLNRAKVSVQSLSRGSQRSAASGAIRRRSQAADQLSRLEATIAGGCGMMPRSALGIKTLAVDPGGDQGECRDALAARLQFLSLPALGPKSSTRDAGLRGHVRPGPATAPNGIAVVDLDPASPSYAQIVGSVAMPNTGDELHHFRWDAGLGCFVDEVTRMWNGATWWCLGLRSSRIHILDTSRTRAPPPL